jgi:hypothetical protein
MISNSDFLIPMELHLNKILCSTLRRDIVNPLIWNEISYKFNDGFEFEQYHFFYKKVCKELGFMPEVQLPNGMNSFKASYVKRKGHEREDFFKLHGMNVVSGRGKTDLSINGVGHASLKAGDSKIQYGLHVIDSLPIEMKEIMWDWQNVAFEEGYSFQRESSAKSIQTYLQTTTKLVEFLNWWLRGDEEVPYLIFREINEEKDTYKKVDYKSLIEELSKKLVVDLSYSLEKGRGNKIVFKADLKSKSKKLVTFMELEYRKGTKSILLHGKIDNLRKFIYVYNVPIIQTYQ